MLRLAANCPKCGSLHCMAGPRYLSEGPRYTNHGHSECLLYTCTVCGYVQREPCADAPKAMRVPPRKGAE